MNRKTKGFSLVELLAVIIVLGIITLIIVPSVLKTLENAKKEAFESSVTGLIASATNYMGESDFADWTGGLTIANIQTNNLFETKNIDKFTSGTLYNNNGTITVEDLTDGNYCANGKKNSLIVASGNCEEVVEEEPPVEEPPVEEPPVIPTYGIDTINLSLFSNWRTGNYNFASGAYETNLARVCLNERITAAASSTYIITISNPTYHVLIRTLDVNYAFIASFNLATGQSFTTTANTVYIAISLYNSSSEVGVTYTTFSNLFTSGLTVTVVKQ